MNGILPTNLSVGYAISLGRDYHIIGAVAK